jgi:hypothetical protein
MFYKQNSFQIGYHLTQISGKVNFFHISLLLISIHIKELAYDCTLVAQMLKEIVQILLKQNKYWSMIPTHLKENQQYVILAHLFRFDLVIVNVGFS